MYQPFLSFYKGLEGSTRFMKIVLGSYLLHRYEQAIMAESRYLGNIPHFSFKVEDNNSLQSKTKKGVHMILFYRTACPYCMRFLPIYQELAQEYEKRRVAFGAVAMSNDYQTRMADKKYIRKHYRDNALSEGLTVNTFPCLVIIKDGEVVEVLQGDEKARNPENLIKLLDYYID